MTIMMLLSYLFNPIAAIEVPDVPNPGDRQGTEKVF